MYICNKVLDENENVELSVEEIEQTENELDQEVITDMIIPSDRPKRNSKLPNKFKDYMLY